MDIDNDMLMDDDSDFVLASPSQFTSAQWHTRDSDADLVKWQGSQTSSVALNALMREAAEPIRRSPRNHHRVQPSWIGPAAPGLSFSGSSGSSSASTSGSNSSFVAKPRVSRLRTRHPPTRIASPSILVSTPASPISTDPALFLQALKDVSEKVKVDESSKSKKRLVSGGVKGLTAGTRSVKENLRRSTTGVREGEKGKSPLIGSRSLPSICGGVVGNEDMAVESSTASQMEDVEMDPGLSGWLDNDGPIVASTPRSNPHPKHNIPTSRSHMPPPPVPITKTEPPRLLHDRPTAVSRPTPKRVPIVSKPKPKSASPQPVLPAPTNSQFNSQPSPPTQPPSRPPNSQLFSRPPALGMRRTLSAYSALAPSQTLPGKQRGFKVPLAKPQAAPTPTRLPAVSQPVPSYRETDPKVAQVLLTPEPSPSIAAKGTGIKDGRVTETQHSSSSPASDPDSSYGDISFDMDALEETMKKYD